MRPYLDVHGHVGFTVARVPMVGQTIGRYLARMASSGVQAAIISPTAGGPQARGVLDTRDQNEVIARACRCYPDRFPLGLAIVEVRQERAGVAELERAMTEDGLVGLMCHPVLSGHSLDAELHPFLEVVAMRRGLCLLHGPAEKIAAHARRFPGVTFIAGHASSNKAGHQATIEHCGPCDNVVFDIAQKPATSDPEWDLVNLVSQLGRERVLFGSDAPYYDYRAVQSLIEAAALDEDTKDRISVRNAVALINRFRPGWTMPSEPVVPPQRYGDEELWAARGLRLL